MNAKGVEGIVVAEAGLDLEDHKGAEEAGGETDEQRGHGLYESGGRGDGDEAGDRAGNCAQSRGLAIVNPLENGPAESGGGSGEVRVDEGAGGQRAGSEGATCIEAEPAHPQQAGANEAEHEGVGRHGGLRVSQPLAEIKRADQRRDAAGDVDNRSAGEVE